MTDEPLQLDKMGELERREMVKLHKSDWYIQLYGPFKRMVDANPPHYVYRVKDTDELCYISSYMVGKDGNPDILEITIDLKYNPNNLTVKKVLITSQVLERVGLRSVASMERLIAKNTINARLTDLKNRNQALRKTRKHEANVREAQHDWELDKLAGKTQHPINFDAAHIIKVDKKPTDSLIIKKEDVK